MEVFGMAAIIALGMKLLGFLKFLRAGDWESSFDQAAAWFAGIVVVAIAHFAVITQNIEIFKGVSLGSLDLASVVLAGMALLSLGGVVYDFQSKGNKKEPSLLTGR